MHARVLAIIQHPLFRQSHKVNSVNFALSESRKFGTRKGRVRLPQRSDPASQPVASRSPYFSKAPRSATPRSTPVLLDKQMSVKKTSANAELLRVGRTFIATLFIIP